MLEIQVSFPRRAIMLNPTAQSVRLPKSTPLKSYFGIKTPNQNNQNLGQSVQVRSSMSMVTLRARAAQFLAIRNENNPTL